jgi:hypothetical protein
VTCRHVPVRVQIYGQPARLGMTKSIMGRWIQKGRAPRRAALTRLDKKPPPPADDELLAVAGDGPAGRAVRVGSERRRSRDCRRSPSRGMVLSVFPPSLWALFSLSTPITDLWPASESAGAHGGDVRHENISYPACPPLFDIFGSRSTSL